MADVPGKEELTSSSNGSIEIPLPTVFCTPVPCESNITKSKTMLSSDSKFSLPSNLGTPTSPMLPSSPFSLPSSPSPFNSGSSNLKSTDRPLSKSPTKSRDSNTKINLLGNSGSATGNPRNKCALQPGHSLMDWIRLGNSGKDLTGVGGRIQPVSPRELAEHNTQKDAWLAIRGRVYNITHYLPYHPGGPEELMRGAGTDATQLFDKVHPWVNYDSLLAKCLIGPLRIEAPTADELFGPSNPPPKSDRLREPSKAQELVRKSMENLANCITPTRKKVLGKTEEIAKGNSPSKIMQSLIQSSDLPVTISRRAGSTSSNNSEDTPPPLRYDWIQTSLKLTLSVYTGPLANPGGCVRIHDGILILEVATNEWVRPLSLIPEGKLQEPLQLRVYPESGKLEVTAQKAELRVWKRCGEVTIGDARRVSTPRTVVCRVTRVTKVSHDTVLLALAPSAGTVVVPLGYHVRVHRRISGMECLRSYTPLGEGWFSNDSDSSPTLKLAIKCYKAGTLSPHLTSVQIDDVITLSGPYGNFQLQRLKPVKTIFLIAAGTGITPMLGILRFMISRSNPRCENMHLLFFNKSVDDILFKSDFDEIAKEDDRLTVTHVLSEPNSSWSGHSGRINSDLLEQSITKEAITCTKPDSCSHFACVCGPAEFTQTSLQLLKNLGMREECVHAFLG